MKIFRTKKELREWRSTIHEVVGFVPTMGYLHEGHAELLRTSIESCDYTVLSIFVNPTQFGPNEDLDRYPRDFERDEELARKVGVDVIFYPTVDEMYSFSSTITFSSGAMANVLCGRSRPGHFDGVLQVVTKLFHIVQPHYAYFGQKDAQQLALIESLVEAYDFPLTIVPVATVREVDGLAKSSRNVFLSDQERKEAPVIHQALQQAKHVFLSTGSSAEAIQEATELIETQTSGKIDYMELLSYPHLTETTEGQRFIVATAVFFSKARLIDNLIIERVNAHVTNDVK